MLAVETLDFAGTARRGIRVQYVGAPCGRLITNCIPRISLEASGPGGIRVRFCKHYLQAHSASAVGFVLSTHIRLSTYPMTECNRATYNLSPTGDLLTRGYHTQCSSTAVGTGES